MYFIWVGFYSSSVDKEAGAFATTDLEDTFLRIETQTCAEGFECLTKVFGIVLDPRDFGQSGL